VNCEGRLIVCGGSNGSDLLRNGIDLLDVYVLDWYGLSKTHFLLSQGGERGCFHGTWSEVNYSNNLSICPFDGTMGRCCSHHLVGRNKMIFFGGSSNLSSTLSTLNLVEEPFEMKKPLLLATPSSVPSTSSSSSSSSSSSTTAYVSNHNINQFLRMKPPKRLSHTWWVYGTTILIYGGWTEIGPSNDLWKLDISPQSERYKKKDTITLEDRTEVNNVMNDIFKDSDVDENFNSDNDSDDDSDDDEDEVFNNEINLWAIVQQYLQNRARNYDDEEEEED